MEDVGIKLSFVPSDILGVSGRAMLEAMIAGRGLTPAETLECDAGPVLRAAPRGGRIERMDSPIPVPRMELRALGEEVAAALRAVTQARVASNPMEALAQLTIAIEHLCATQHELVNVLLDHGHSWSEVGEALSTSASAAERRFPRRERRE